MIFQTRNRTEQKDIAYALYLYFDGLSLRNTSKALSRFVKRSHSTKREWIQRYKPERLFFRRIKISGFNVYLFVSPSVLQIINNKCRKGTHCPTGENHYWG